MAEQQAQGGEKKGLNMALIATLGFTVLNLAVVGGGAYLVYASTLGWKAPSITEKSLRKPASAKAEKKEAPAAEGHGNAGEAAAGAAAESEAEVTLFLQKLDKFTVNLAGEPKRTIRLEVNLELLNQESFEEVMDAGRVPKIRDRIVAVLNEKTLSDLESMQGKLFLKDKIASEVNGLLDEGVVKDVYFTEFVVQ